MKTEILDAAIKLLASKGMSVSLREIAREVQVSPGLIIHHFDSRENLIENAIQACLNNLLARKQALATSSHSSGFVELFFEVSEPELGLLRQVLVTDSTASETLFELAIQSAREYLISQGSRSDEENLKMRSALLAAQALGSIVLLPQLRKISKDIGPISADSMASNLFAGANLVRSDN